MKEQLSNMFYYKNGNLYNKYKRSSNSLKDAKIGSERHTGYIAVSIDGKSYLLHRLIWGYFNGDIPENIFIDHINRDKSDNRIENLRLATKAQNNTNRPKYKNNKTGFKGVSYYKALNKYSASIRFNDKKIHLGYFNCPTKAGLMFAQKSKELYKEFSFA